MKKLLFLVFFLASAVILHAETVNVPIAGKLSGQLTAANINTSTVTSLTITGTIDSTDIVVLKTMATSNSLSVIDLSGASISGNAIPDSAFYFCKKLTSLIIPNSVTTIGDYAFGYCTGLTSLTIPNSVTTIGNFAFYNCSGLTSLTISNSVTTIGNSAFGFCRGLTSVTIPNSVTTIGDYAFYNCSGLTSVTIPNSVTTIGDYAFYNCSGLTSLTIPNSVTTIGNSAFYNDKCSITVDTGNTEFSSLDGVLFNADKTVLIFCPISKTGSYTIPNSVTSIEDYAFQSCRYLTTINIPNSVTSIGYQSFAYCHGLTSVSIPSSVTTIKRYAFGWCSGLTSITLPDSITSINDDVFYACKSLATAVIPNSVTSIGVSAFAGCTGLTSVTIPPSVTSIGKEAFLGCSSLTSISIPNSVTTIESGSFFNCSGLTSVSIPSSVTSIGNWAFYLCSGLTSVSIPSSVTSIGKEAFYNCSKLSEVYVYNKDPGNIALAGSTIFSGIKSPATLYVPSGSASQYLGWASHTWSPITEMTTGALSVTIIDKNIACTEGSTALVNVTSNIAWGATYPNSIDSKWLSLNFYAAKGDAPLTFIASANTSTSARTATVKLTTYDNEATQTITVTQDGAVLPGVTTQGATDIMATTATGNGNITALGSPTPTAFGICYSTSSTPTITDSNIDNGTATNTGPFTASLKGLTPNTLYYARAYATNIAGTSYGDVVSFTTPKVQLTIANPSLSAKKYDGTTDASTVITPGAVTGILTGSPDVTVSVAFANFSSKEVGTSKTVTVSYNLSGADKEKYIVPVNSTVTGVISAKDLTVMADASQTKVYGSIDPALLYSVSPALVSGDAFIGSLSRASGENVGSYDIEQGSLSAGGNYSIIFTGNNYTITAKQLTITDPVVVTNKLYDGTTSAAITTLGTLQGIEVADAATVSVSGTANYSDASVGTAKTISVDYSLTGSAAANYLAPAPFVINNATIFENITLGPIPTPEAGCEGSSLNLVYTIVTGTPTQYQITFDANALSAGFRNTGFTALPAGNNLSIAIPSGTADGTYQASLQMQNAVGTISAEYNFAFTINVSSAIIVSKFSDVILCDNSSNRFAGYQWYKDGAAISGATGQFYNDKNGLSGAYSLQVTITSGEILKTCPVTFSNATLSVAARMSIYPNPAIIGQTITVTIEGLGNEGLSGATMTINNSQGMIVYRSDKVSATNTFILNSTGGAHVIHLTTSDGREQTGKLILIK